MKRITISEFESSFDVVMDNVLDGESYTICTDDDEPMAVLIPYEEYEAMQEELGKAADNL